MDMLNVESEIYARIWDVLAADEDWAEEYAEGNRIRYDSEDEDSAFNPGKDLTTDGDHTSAELWPLAGDTLLALSDPVFATFSEENDCGGAAEEQSYTFQLRLISPTLNVRKFHKGKALTERAIRAAGPKLNVADKPFLEYLAGVRLSWTTTKEDVDATGGTYRWKTDVRIIVRAQPDVSNLKE